MNEKGDMMNTKEERGGAPQGFSRRPSPGGRPRPVKLVPIDLNDPEIARANAELRRFTEDQLFFEEMYHEFLERYPEKWVAVYHKEVVGVDEDFMRLLKSLKASGYQLTRLAINRVRSKPVNRIFGGGLID